MRATLKDIGAELGLSVATVSRALNGFPEVNAKTRAAVEEAAERLNYRPNRLAQKLVSGRSNMVGMVARMTKDAAADRGFVEIMLGLSARLAEKDIDLVFQVDVDADPVAPYRRLIAKNTLDGFILNAPLIDDPRIAYLNEMGVPFVVHGRAGETADYPYYDIDNHAVSARAVTLLADLGHRRIALANGVAGDAYSRRRLIGFNQTLERFGMATPEVFVAHGTPNEDHGYTFGLAALSGRFGAPPTAFLCSSTLVAAGLYRAAADRGLTVPDDVSIIAHDDAMPALRAINFDPALTVTRAPLRDACVPLADKLIRRLAGAEPKRLQTTFEPELIIRRSTGPVKQGEEDPW
ncbi:LacI family DNA-binding transcriptional regulator [Cucumibacter marinus]|uniref:LacI family DNA-binding transcriptional regulator n=1 Tax=Cucumibacter marinus TaxID=1121252 RepID=UPI0004249BBA|nr:substrate-binding domain-containing protein [Cucumibacter marinus]